MTDSRSKPINKLWIALGSFVLLIVVVAISVTWLYKEDVDIPLARASQGDTIRYEWYVPRDDTYISSWFPTASYNGLQYMRLRGGIEIGLLNFDDGDHLLNTESGGKLELYWIERSNTQGGQIKVYQAPNWDYGVAWEDGDWETIIAEAMHVGTGEIPETIPSTTIIELTGFHGLDGLILDLVVDGSVFYKIASTESEFPPLFFPNDPATFTPVVTKIPPVQTSTPTPVVAGPTNTPTTTPTPATVLYHLKDCTMLVEQVEGSLYMEVYCGETSEPDSD